MKIFRKSNIIPLFILLFVCSYTTYALVFQTTTTDASNFVIKTLISIIGVIGSGLVAIIVYVFNQMLKRVDTIMEKLEEINIHGCAAFSNAVSHRKQNTRKKG